MKMIDATEYIESSFPIQKFVFALFQTVAPNEESHFEKF